MLTCTVFGAACRFKGIGSVIKEARGDQCKVYGCEPITASPLAASFASIPVERCKQFKEWAPSFVDGCGGKSVLAPIWPVASKVLDGGFAVNIADVADAIKLLVEKNRVVAEGAGACPVAAARRGMAVGAKKIVCVVSGGGLDTDKLVEILSDVKNEEKGIAKGGRTGGKGNGGGCISNGGGNSNGTADDAASIFSVLWHAACVYTALAVWNQHWA